MFGLAGLLLGTHRPQIYSSRHSGFSRASQRSISKSGLRMLNIFGSRARLVSDPARPKAGCLCEYTPSVGRTPKLKFSRNFASPRKSTHPQENLNTGYLGLNIPFKVFVYYFSSLP
ncbi:hypothetical protein BDN70DRAFT_872025 [Pholiota conissans]|uniref:Uncharacterized protein n=1 Tax=Pholiota conissans TaxID=109636 RepID=A0A9P6D5Q3_9AGAR|nr:hypothetical protein BDN70DRAFT_872025 [Pholiota conissans]